MPSRWFCLVIVGFWLFATGWMLKRDWLPWFLATDEAPPFVFELADEVVTQHAVWNLTRGKEKLGLARTTLRYVNKNSFEWIHVLKNLEYKAEFGGFRVQALLPTTTTVMYVTSKGELTRFSLESELKMGVSGIELKAEMKMSGTVSDGQVSGECSLASELGELKQAYGPVPLKGNNVFSPLQPLFRIRGLHLGKSWKLNQYNPINDAFLEVFEQLGKKYGFPVPRPPGGSSELLAEVLPEYKEIDLKEDRRKCFVIEYRDEKLVARTWVDVMDGTVWRQEGFLNGDSLVLERD